MHLALQVLNLASLQPGTPLKQSNMSKPYRTRLYDKTTCTVTTALTFTATQKMLPQDTQLHGLSRSTKTDYSLYSANNFYQYTYLFDYDILLLLPSR